MEIDFQDAAHPVVTPLDFDFSATGYALCIIDSQASHADLTDEYAAIPVEMKAIAAHFGKEVLSEVPEQEFYGAIPLLRQKCGDGRCCGHSIFIRRTGGCLRPVRRCGVGILTAFCR